MATLKFTVIIPTRERSDVLGAAIKTVLAQDFENLEIIVSDNFSCDDTESVVASFNSNKIRYINTGKRVGMSQNWEFALSHVSEGWVALIGDDDGLLPGSLTRVAEIIRLTGTQAIRSATCSYGWPGLNEADYGRLGVPLQSGWEKRSSKKWIESVMMGKCSYTNLPVLYNGGFVDIEVLKNIKSKSGAFFHSMTPDVYMGLAIPSIIPDYIYMFEPLAINGASRHSGGTCASSTKSNSNNSPSEKYYSEPNIPFHDALPLDKDGRPVFSIQAIIYESYLQSMCLRESSEFENHQKQLELILASSGVNNDTVAKWGVNFAERHGLNLEKAQTIAKYHSYYHNVFKWLGKVNKNLATYRVNSDSQCPLNDVYEASIAAATVRTIGLSRVKNFFHLMKFVWNRIVRR